MSDELSVTYIAGHELRHVHSSDELASCFPVMSSLRTGLKDVHDWVDQASDMATDGYRVLAAWRGDRVVAVAGYRTMVNLIHGHFLYVDDLVTAPEARREGLGSRLLTELSAIAIDEGCQRLVLDTAATNAQARLFYKREGLSDLAIGFVKTLGQIA